MSVESAKWGDYRATLHNVNHLDVRRLVLSSSWAACALPGAGDSPRREPRADPSLAHLPRPQLIGWVGKVRYSFAAWSGHEIKFRPISMFCTIAEQLADEGL